MIKIEKAVIFNKINYFLYGFWFKTDRQEIAEMLLKVALNIINLIVDRASN
jgi:hypothetical protein